jgi:hypothetical protein
MTTSFSKTLFHEVRQQVRAPSFYFIYTRHTKYSVITLDGRMFYFTGTCTIKQLLEIILNEIKLRKNKKYKKGMRDKDTKQVIPSRLSR